jgi:hypothetical protein
MINHPHEAQKIARTITGNGKKFITLDEGMSLNRVGG